VQELTDREANGWPTPGQPGSKELHANTWRHCGGNLPPRRNLWHLKGPPEAVIAVIMRAPFKNGERRGLLGSAGPDQAAGCSSRI